MGEGSFEHSGSDLSSDAQSNALDTGELLVDPLRPRRSLCSAAAHPDRRSLSEKDAARTLLGEQLP